MSIKSLLFAAFAALAITASAQDQSSSSAVMTRGPRTRPGQQNETQSPATSARMQQRSDASKPESALKYMRVIYRELDLVKEDANAPLYFPEDLVDGQENLFRIMFRLLAQNKVPAYEHLDGREDFTEANRVKMDHLIKQFDILATPAKGFSEKNPVYDIEPVDVPTNEVLAYYIIERWEFDNRTNRMETTVEAICPVVVRDDNYSISGKTPMFWMKMSDLRPYLRSQFIFTDDDNNLARYTYDDFFTLNMYKGDIYKTRNLRNRTLEQIAGGDPEELKRAQDSIQNRLDHYADNLWVPSREEIARQREIADSIAAAADTTLIAETPARSARASRSSKASTRSREAKRAKTKTREPKKEKVQKPKSSSSATRSVRNRRK